VVLMSAEGSRSRFVRLRGRSGIVETSFSPDGRRIAYEGSGPGRYPWLWSARINGSGQRRLALGHSPHWSPNGRTIAYVNQRGELLLMNASTGRHIRNLDFAGGALDWSPDGRRLLTGGGSSPGYRIVRADGRGRPRELALTQKEDTMWLDAVFSPDGRRIAMVSREADDEEARYSIWTTSVRGTAPRRIYRSKWVDTEETSAPLLSWAPRTR
jgi:Tol biopolymer transport system component